jgi:hypothetical protein
MIVTRSRATRYYAVSGPLPNFSTTQCEGRAEI